MFVALIHWSIKLDDASKECWMGHNCIVQPTKLAAVD
jgi:hypothetical protein